MSLARESDGCASMAPLPRPPVIDGQLDQGLKTMPLSPRGWTGPTPVPNDIEARYVAAWHADGIYVFVAVDRATLTPAAGADLFCGDGVELFVDSDGAHTMAPAYDDPGAIQLIVTPPGDIAPRAERYRTYARIEPWRTGAWRSVRTASGFAVEAFVAAADLDLEEWTLTEAARVGLNIAVDVAGPTMEPSCEGRLGQFVLRVDPDAAAGVCPLPYCNVRAFCTATLDP